MSKSVLQRTARTSDTTVKHQRIVPIRANKAAVSKSRQTGARAYPVPPFPKQHLTKPGLEANLDPTPMYDAPFYLCSKKFAGKVALITGSDSGIGRAVAVMFAREGADVVIVHLAEDGDAERTKRLVEDKGKACLIIAGDVRKRAFCQTVLRKTVKKVGKPDVLVNNAAFQFHSDALEDLTEKHFDETIKTDLYG